MDAAQAAADAATAAAAAGTGLPSDNDAVDLSGFEINEDMQAKFKDGKLNGRFGNLNEVLDKLKEAEDFKSNTIREQTAAAASATDSEAAQAAAVVQQGIVMEMLPEFAKNGMALTPEMEAKAKEAGIDIRDLKLGALELKDKITAAHSTVGGADNYDAMLAWGKDNMSDAQKKAFDKDVTGGMSEFAIKGLFSDYEKAVASGTVVPRIEGNAHVSGIQPYADRRELYKDKDYIESSQGRRDKAAIAKYRERLRVTSNDVLGI